MTGKDIFKIWAPPSSKWTQWVRPVPFITITNNLMLNEVCNIDLHHINYINVLKSDTAIIVDLQGIDSIKEGISLAKLGYRPIPLYNGTQEQKGAIATCDNHSISYGLVWGALQLKNIQLANDALPAFLLDTNRLHRYKMNASVFDNSWDIYPQDLPSAEYFINNGINKIIVRAEKIQIDLRKILYDYQKKGIKILFTDGYGEPSKVIIKKPLYKKKYW